jgi:eukaryotic-like serine/threonine-protein kinase
MDTTMTLSSGTRFGPYEVESPLGAGGMGEVYQARDTRLGRRVALKILPQKFASDARFRARFDREARAIATLNHPNICVLHDVGDGYLVMELLEGDTLSQKIARGRLPIAQAVEYGTQIANALDAAHRSGVVHRDLKPANIMITSSGAKLFDFGLAKEFLLLARASDAPTQQDPFTAAGTIVGTLPYMAPEQVEGLPADSRTDIFALGSILYEMLSGRRAFNANSQPSLIVDILEHDPPPLSTGGLNVPPSLEHVIRRCLAKKPEDRWQSASDIARELQFAVSGEVSVVRPRRSVAATKIIAGVLLVLAGLIGGAAAAHFRSPSKPEALFTKSSIEAPPGVSLDQNQGPVISPDGKRVAFIAADAHGTVSIWLRALDSLTASALDGTAGAAFVSWSPDSRHLLFGTPSKINRIDTVTGKVAAICDASDPRGATENNQGDVVYAPTYAHAPLMRVSVNGGAPSVVTHFAAGETSHRWPQFLPDGDHVLFFAAEGSDGRSEIGSVCVASLTDGTSERLLDASSHAVFMKPDMIIASVEGVVRAWRFDPQKRKVRERLGILPDVDVNDDTAYTFASGSDNDVLIYLSRSARPPETLQWFDRRGKPLEMVGHPSSFETIELSPDGSKLAVAEKGDIWIDDLRRGIATRATVRRTVDRNPVWSPDGETLAYNSSRPGKYETRLKPASSALAPDRSILDSSSPLDWSSDGHFIVLSSGTSPHRKTVVYSVAEKTIRPYADDSFGYESSRISPDGKWLAFICNLSGRDELYVDTFPVASHRVQISNAGAQWPRWSRNTQELFYVDTTGELVAVTVRAVTHAFDAGAPVPLFRLNNGFAGYGNYDVSPDGQRFIVITRPEYERRALTLVTNWKNDLQE